jgi:subtilase family serine protease
MNSDTRASVGSRRSWRQAWAILLGAVLSCSWGAGAALAAVRAAIPRSFTPSTDVDTGTFTSANMTVEIVLAPRDPAALSRQLQSVYDPGSAGYHQWLARGQFDARFAPDSGTVSAITSYLQSRGLSVQQTSSPFLLRVSGPSSTVEGAFSTSIHNFRNPQGVRYFANTSALKLPASLVSGVLGVVGMTNTVRLQGQFKFDRDDQQQPSCEAPYPTRAQFYEVVHNHKSFPYGYGGGPGCNGLTPSQTNSIYDAPEAGWATKGSGVNLAVFELSAYQPSDIQHWAHQFYGQRYSPPLVDVTVDGGPLNPDCPTGDTCPAKYNGYSGDIEVDADIEAQLSMAPAARHIYVYNAPNDYTGQTEIDEYVQIANDDVADVVSSSWGVCENDAGAGYAEAENLIFEQMALQGQSMFAAAGDTGAFGCLRSDGTSVVNVGDPSSQPWVTSVGGTSLESFNPGSDPTPEYPWGVETVWNVDGLCNTSVSEGGKPGLFWCGAVGAGGGGSSQYWGRPFYQSAPGVNNRYTTYGNGTTQCALAATGTPCREVPDVSANADEYTPYAEYCTGNASTPYSVCATITGTPAGWFGIGGTSLSSPIWSGIIADRDGVWRGRIGNANPLLYALARSAQSFYFNDITGGDRDDGPDNNGLFPTTRGYDLATGLGTPRIAPLILMSPEY